jgi:site-specific recombinase XerD
LFNSYTGYIKGYGQGGIGIMVCVLPGNEYVKRINEPVVTYYARNSFATIIQNSRALVAMISKALGHSSISTTQNYLGSFETDQLKDATSALTAFKK